MTRKSLKKLRMRPVEIKMETEGKTAARKRQQEVMEEGERRRKTMRRRRKKKRRKRGRNKRTEEEFECEKLKTFNDLKNFLGLYSFFFFSCSA